MKKQNLKNKILNTKRNSGITLIALIITIIVLLILAVVAISSVNNTGMVKYAQNSKVAYIDGRDKEDTTLENYVDILNHYKPTEDNTNPLDPEPEEIVWSYIDYGDDYYTLRYIGNSTELELTEDKELKVYPGIFNEDTEEYEYDNTKTINMELSEVEKLDIGYSVEKVTVGEVARNLRIMYPDNEISLVILEEYGDIPEEKFVEMNIKSIVIQDGITSIGNFAFGENDIKSLTLPASVIDIAPNCISWGMNGSGVTIYYGGTQDQWEAISSAFPSGYNIKVIFNDGTEKVL